MKSTVRRLQLALLKRAFDHKSRGSINLSKPQKILFDQKEDLIGDMLVNTVAFRAIKQAYPDWDIHVLSGPTNLEVLRSNPFVDEVHVFKGTGATIRRLAKQQFDLYYFNKNRLHVRDFILLKFLGATVNIGRDKEGFELFDYSLSVQGETELDRYLALLKFLRVNGSSNRYDFPLTSVELATACEHLAQRPGKPVIIFNRYGNRRGKLFSRACSVQLLQEVDRVYPNAQIILLSPPQTKTETIDFARQLDLSNVRVAEFTRTIRDSAALIHCADLVITPDTSVVHIACAYDKAQICVYRDQNEMRLWRPLSEKAITLLPKPPSRNVDDLDLAEFSGSLMEIKRHLPAIGAQ